MDVSTFISRVRERKSVVGIVGLGYVGLPLMLTFTKRGVQVIGFDVDAEKIRALKEGNSYIRHIPATEILHRVTSGQFVPTADFAQATTCDALILCVPTPLNKNREPDLSFVSNTAQAIAP